MSNGLPQTSLMGMLTMANETRITSRRHRPWLLSLLFWVLTLWSLLGWLRFTRAVLDRELILTLLSPGLFGYLMAAGLVWGIVPLPALWGLLTGAAWAPRWIWVAAVVPPVVYWFERSFLWRETTSNAPLMMILTALWACVTILALGSKRSQQFFNHSKQGKQSDGLSRTRS